MSVRLALSTAWAGGDLNRVLEILPHVDSLEIGSKGDRDFFTDLDVLIRDERIPVTSIHAVAHPGKQVGEAYYAPQLASIDEQVRMRELEEISATAEWALDIGTQALVIHTGRIEDDELRSMCLEFRDGVWNGKDEQYRQELFQEIIHRRAGQSRPYLESIMDGLDLLCSRFPDLSFFIETRVHYYEIPLPDELETIFNALPYPNLGYWNDIGHTQMLDILGFVPMRTWQERFSARCGGTHIHDMDAELLDHYPPGEGVLDIHNILEQFDADVLLTLEINARHDYESVIRGIRYLRADRICV